VSRYRHGQWHFAAENNAVRKGRRPSEVWDIKIANLLKYLGTPYAFPFFMFKNFLPMDKMFA
jgi:hypothetical protein